MDIHRVNGINKDLSEITLNHKIIISKNMHLYCGCCNLELIRPPREENIYYNHLNNNISVNRSIITDKAPHFYCCECWETKIKQQLYNLININIKL